MNHEGNRPSQHGFVSENSLSIREAVFGDGMMLCPECGHMAINQRGRQTPTPEKIQVLYGPGGDVEVVVPLECANDHEFDVRVGVDWGASVDLVQLRRYNVPVTSAVPDAQA